MKKIMLLTVTGIILFYIVPISTTHALLLQGQGPNNTTSDTGMAAYNQSSPLDISPRLDNPNFEDNLLTDTMNDRPGTLLVQGGGGAGGGGTGSGSGGGTGVSGGGKSKGSTSRSTNQNVQRTGSGRSEMGDYNDAEKKPEKNKGDEAEWDETDWEESEW